MRYKVDTITPFRKAAKNWLKSILHLKMNWPNSEVNFRKSPPLAHLLGTIATKYVLPLLQKEKVNPVVRG